MPRLTAPLLILVVVVVSLGACGNKARTGAPSPGQGPRPTGLTQIHAAAGLPKICDDYRRAVLRCVESSNFPAAAREGQLLALEQMLAIVRQNQRGGEGDGAAAADERAATDNCRDSLTTLVESAKQSCPGVL